MVHTVATGLRLMDVIDLVESDQRVQLVFTQAPDAFNNGVTDFLRATDGIVLPWHQACRERFDLALAAAHGGLHELHAPLMVLPHGAGRGKLCLPQPGSRATEPTVYGLDAQRLTRDGQVLASAVVLAHEDELAVLERQCPAAMAVAVVAGDTCYDRLIASLPHRARYRDALGVAQDEELVVVSSSWGPASIAGRLQEILPQLLDELTPAGLRVAALVHPAVWFGHGPRQVRAWLSDCRDAGLLLVGPETDWRAVVVAADHVVGDHGSVPVYAAAIGRSVLQVAPPAVAVTAAGSPHALLRRTVPQLSPGAPILRQLRDAEAQRPDYAPLVAQQLTSRPGSAGVELRRAMYHLLRLAEPGQHRQLAPVPVPDRGAP